MKKLILIPILTLLVGATSVFAQSKIAYVQYDYLIGLMPELDEVQAKLEEKQKGYEAIIAEKKNEMGQIESLIQNNPNMDETIKEAKIRRYQSIQMELQEFAYKAQEKMNLAEVELMKPVYDKLDKAIKEVALAKGYDYVLSDNNQGGFVVLFAKNESDNLTKAVMEKLGLKADVAPTNGTQATESLMVKP